MFIKELSGHSGCRLELHKDGEILFVRKISPGTAYNPRLKLQCAKQRRFASTPQLAAPVVLNQGLVEDNFYFDMAFIQGKSMAEYFSVLNIHDIADYIKILFQSLRLAESETSARTGGIFEEKIRELKSATGAQPQAQKALETLACFDWTGTDKSPCHGDLTLENIIITPRKEIYLIDFLDSFYNSWMMDIAKLLQDLELGWSFRHHAADTTRSLKLLVAKEALFDEIQKMDKAQDIIRTIYHLLLLNIVRIYPYTNDTPTIGFLNLSVQKIMGILQQNAEHPLARRKVANT